jgi:hypothetical protein
MSDKRNVARDNSSGTRNMTTAVHRAGFYLNELTKLQHRGRGDTWSAARDRAAKKAGIPQSYAKRIWDRIDTMTDVSGEALYRLYLEYQASCEHHENKAAEYRAEREAIRNAMAESGARPSLRESAARD